MTCTSELSGSLTVSIGYTTKIEEVDLHVFEHHVRLRRHALGRPAVPDLKQLHHVILVTLKDGSGWVIDPAGAQHGQAKPVLSVFQYNAMFIQKILFRRPYGESKLYFEKFVNERHPRDALNLVAIQLAESLEPVEDELEEWQLKHTSIEAIIKANASDYQRLKAMLVAHLATAAREFIKYLNRDPTSTAKPININSNSATLSEEDRLRLKRKRGRELAAMHPSVRELVESQKAQGTEVLML